MEEKRKKAEYRSSIRSKTLIRSALVSLMQEKPFEKITITDIVRKADINRGTFYAHFKDSREVLERIRADALHEMEEAFYSLPADTVMRDPRPLLERITKFLSEESSYYNMLLSTTGIQEFLNEIKQIAMKYFLDSDLAKNHLNRDLLILRLDFIISAAAGIYYDIVIGSIPLKLDGAAEFICSMLQPYLPK